MTDIVKYQAEQKTLEDRYIDIIAPNRVETRTSAEEIIDTIIGKLGKEADG